LGSIIQGAKFLAVATKFHHEIGARVASCADIVAVPSADFWPASIDDP
jgi:hypothetical protein